MCRRFSEDEALLGRDRSRPGTPGPSDRGPQAIIPIDAKLQLGLAAIHALFSLLHSKQDLAETVWYKGGDALVRTLLMLGSRLKDNFEEEATKLLVVLLSNHGIQVAARDAGLVKQMVGMTMTSDSASVLIATKALAVVCRNSSENQKEALNLGLLDKCIQLLATGMDIYTAKWVILVINALVYDNMHAQKIVLELNAVPLLVKWLVAGPEHEVATAAARALAKSAKGNAAIQRSICDSGGIQAFVAMLTGKPSSLAVRAAAEALSDLAKDNISGQNRIREAGALPRLLELMRSMQSTSLVVTVTRTLSVLAHANAVNMQAIHDLDCIPVLLTMLVPTVGSVINAAAADLLRVLCSNPQCQEVILANHGIEALLTSLRENTYPAAQSAAVWALNAVVQGHKSVLPTLMEPQIMDTFMQCISKDNGGAPGTVRLLLVMFLHSGKHVELRRMLQQDTQVLKSLLVMIQQGPEQEPTKWSASLLSTLCWQEDSIKQVMVKLHAPKVLASTLEVTINLLRVPIVTSSGNLRSSTSIRTIIESTISTVQALISLTSDSSKSEVCENLATLALDANCVPLLCKSACACLPALMKVQGRDTSSLRQQLDKLLKPHLIALEYLLPMTETPPQLVTLLNMIDENACTAEDMVQHANAIRSKFVH